ncbi:unnamed protein product [Prorocentrum cordatum]|uniref:Uncharacterized protein n=1 Tax=Prorocentrum cordatum TaxID=2364126 RepID=A0ABN9VLW1_9DINO|nr:unnamed protein product [Polarella glacialis]
MTAPPAAASGAGASRLAQGVVANGVGVKGAPAQRSPAAGGQRAPRSARAAASAAEPPTQRGYWEVGHCSWAVHRARGERPAVGPRGWRSDLGAGEQSPWWCGERQAAVRRLARTLRDAGRPAEGEGKGKEVARPPGRVR